MKSKKDKVLKAIFIISIIPYILLFLTAIRYSIFGFRWFNTVSYGISAFRGAIGITVLGLGWFLWPIIPYQVFYLIYVRRKEIGSLKRAIISVTSVVSIVCAVAIFVWQQSVDFLGIILMITGIGLILWDKKKHAKEKFDI